jgi:hypothetical protein
MPKDFTPDKLISADLMFAKGILLLDQCENPTPWAIEGTGTAGGGAWDVTNSVYLQEFSVAAQDISPRGLFFKPDGLKMYVIGDTGDKVYEYDLGIAWDVSTAVYLQEFSVAAKEVSPKGLFFKSDGFKMYTVGTNGVTVDEYDLGTAWDISTAVYLQEFSVAAKEQTPNGMYFKPNGTKMYIIGIDGDTVDEYDLGTAWDVSTAVYLHEFSVAAKEQIPQGLFFKPDGLKMYTIGSDGDTVDEYDLGTAWDVSTAVYLHEFSVAAKEQTPNGLFFKSDGSKMYTIGIDGDTVDEYDLGAEPTDDYGMTAEEEAACFGSYGFKLVTKETSPAHADMVTATRKVAFPETDLLVYRLFLCVTDISKCLAFWIRADFNDGSNAYAAALKWLPNNKQLQYLDLAGNYQTITGYGQTGVDGSWINIEMVLSLTTHEYISCTFNGIKTSLKGINFQDEGAVENLYHDFQIGLLANGANQSVVYLDSIYIGEFLNI